MHGRTDARTDGRTDNVKTVYPLQTKFAGGIIMWGPEFPMLFNKIHDQRPYDSGLFSFMKVAESRSCDHQFKI